MKVTSLLLVVSTLIPVLSLAQAKTSPGLTVTPAKSTTSTNPNRQQELYDQYHGVNPRATPTPAPTAGSMSRTKPDKPTRTQPDRTAQTERPERAAPTSSDDSPAAVRIGLRGGVTRLFYTETTSGFDPALSFVGGLVFNFGSGAISFQPEINYARYAAQSTFSVSGTTFSTKVAADEIEIPLFLKIASGNANSTRFFINVGPYASYLLNTSTDGKTESLNGVDGRFGFGAAAGVGAAIKAGPGHFTIEVRGLYSLGNTSDGFNTDSKVIQSQATLGYMIPLGGR